MKLQRPVISILLRYVNHGNKKDVNYLIAKAMLDNYELIGDKTIHEMAELCFVSASSLSRFVKVIGFDNYSDFKESAINIIDIDVDYSIEVSRAKKEDLIPIFNQYTENIIDNIQFFNENINFEQLNKLTEMIYKSENIIFLGLEFATLIGYHFQIKMAELNKHIKIGDTYEEQFELVNNMPDKSLIIIASLEGGYFYRNYDIIKILEEKKSDIIVLTMNEHIKPVQHIASEIVVISKSNSNTEGRISLLYAIETLIMLYYINYKNV
ncbi:MAG: MurR/RpiR family transcriptional regulator [Erysipelotrichaceae bacterium]|nr:MurR/RpiR family transcriptional regulator [Erysipelotrichaceae bacterium]